jgi:SAM-dependent methyltransferase
MIREGKSNVIFRTKQESEMEILDGGILSSTEWADEESYNRIFDSAWDNRYDYEAQLTNKIINNNNCKKIIELGPGPGMLCNKVLKLNSDLEYHLVDIEAAKQANVKENLGGTFHVKDLNNDFDIDGLPTDFDLFVANDFLEHIQNPARVVLKAKSILKEKGLAFISVPNWRMGHGWIYRGLFDWDNFIHFMWNHGFEFIGYERSPLKCPYNPKISSELSMPDEMINSWNFYMLFKRNDNE